MKLRNTEATMEGSEKTKQGVSYHLFSLSILLCVLFFGLTGCKPATPPQPPKPDIESLKREVVETYSTIVFANYSDALLAALNLHTALETFVNQPSEATMDAAKNAWKLARIPYLQAEAYRFYNGPIDNPINGPEPLINAWPLDEAYVDYVKGDTTSGIIINQTMYPEITEPLLVELNEKNGETNISTGYHVIEFLLWGQDQSAQAPGTRPVSDYIGNESTPGNYATRRADYLLKASRILVQHLDQLTQAWTPEREDNYRAQFLSEPTNDAIAKIFTGITTLSGSELCGERLVVPYETQAQEDEQSCFSDNTNIDIIENARAIQNVYLGRYQRMDGSLITGKSLSDLLTILNPKLASDLTKTIAESVTLAQAIPSPFDQAIQGSNETPGRQAIRSLIENLEKQTRLLEDARGSVEEKIGEKEK